MPEFSVIIPLYNKSNFIVETIESVLQQHFKDFEVIIVDDASTDDSFSKVKSIKDPRIKLFKQAKNKGLSTTRNVAIHKAKGKIIALIDADDIWKPEHLEHIFILRKIYPKASVFGTNWIQKVDEKEIVVKTNIDNHQEHLLIKSFFRASLYEPIVCPSSLAFKKEVFYDVDGFDESLEVGEDTDFLIQANLKFKFAYHQAPTCMYSLFSENQITTGKLNNKKLPDFSKYERKYPEHLQLKKYLDVQRYSYALHYKAEGNRPKMKTLVSEIDLNNLNNKQKILLQMPKELYVFVKRIKLMLMKKSFKITSF